MYRRVVILIGILWGVVIAAGVTTYVRDHMVPHPIDLSIAQYILVTGIACIPSIPTGHLSLVLSAVVVTQIPSIRSRLGARAFDSGND